MSGGFFEGGAVFRLEGDRFFGLIVVGDLDAAPGGDQSPALLLGDSVAVDEAGAAHRDRLEPDIEHFVVARGRAVGAGLLGEDQPARAGIVVADDLRPESEPRDLEVGHVDGIVDMVHRVEVAEPHLDLDLELKVVVSGSVIPAGRCGHSVSSYSAVVVRAQVYGEASCAENKLRGRWNIIGTQQGTILIELRSERSAW